MIQVWVLQCEPPAVTMPRMTGDQFHSSPSAASGDSLMWEGDSLASPHAQDDKAERVRHMFDAIAPTYELINRLASMGRDRYWRREMVRLARVRPDDDLVDIACGTGNVVRAFAAAAVHPRRIIGLDFSWQMLHRAAHRRSAGGIFLKGDAHRLPLSDRSVSIVTCAFGIRNFQGVGAGLSEICRVLRVGGRAVILEFSIPDRAILRQLYLFYFKRVMPWAATLISRDRGGAYRYLPRSVLSFFGDEAICRALERAGFSEVTVNRRSCGIVTVYVATKGR